MGKIEIIWSPEARLRFEEVYEYLLSEWSLRVANNFRQQSLDQIDLLSSFPELGVPVEDMPGLRKRLLTSHNYLYYRFSNDIIIVLDIVDTRQEPL